jgi:hypothetical protein
MLCPALLGSCAVAPQAIKPEGGWLVFDMRGATPTDNLTDPQLLPLAPVLYGFSVHVCLPSGAGQYVPKR